MKFIVSPEGVTFKSPCPFSNNAFWEDKNQIWEKIKEEMKELKKEMEPEEVESPETANEKRIKYSLKIGKLRNKYLLCADMGAGGREYHNRGKGFSCFLEGIDLKEDYERLAAAIEKHKWT